MLKRKAKIKEEPIKAPTNEVTVCFREHTTMLYIEKPWEPMGIWLTGSKAATAITNTLKYLRNLENENEELKEEIKELQAALGRKTLGK